jgi:hypothetical protein
VHVNEKRAAGDHLGLPLATGQQPTLRVLRGGADGPYDRHGRRARKDTADRGDDSGTRLVRDKAIGNPALDDTDSNRLKLELTHRIDLSDPSSAYSRQCRKLRSSS